MKKPKDSFIYDNLDFYENITIISMKNFNYMVLQDVISVLINRGVPLTSLVLGKEQREILTKDIIEIKKSRSTSSHSSIKLLRRYCRSKNIKISWRQEQSIVGFK